MAISFKENLLKDLRAEIRAISYRIENHMNNLNSSSKSHAYDTYLGYIESCVEEMQTIVNYIEELEKLTDDEIKSSLFGKTGVDL